MTDIEIARSVNLKPIKDIATSLGLDEEIVEYYGKYKAKIDFTKVNKEPIDTVVLPSPAAVGLMAVFCR